MSAGRPPKPTSLKLVEGNRGRQKLNKQEPDPAYLADLTAPDWLSASAKVVWDEIVPHLRHARLLTTVDVPMLSSGCIAIAQYRHASKMVGDNAVIDAESYEDDGVMVVKRAAQLNQWLIAQSMAFKQAMAVFQQFGMSPAARTRIAIQPQGDLFGNGTETSKNYFT